MSKATPRANGQHNSPNRKKATPDLPLLSATTAAAPARATKKNRTNPSITTDSMSGRY